MHIGKQILIKIPNKITSASLIAQIFRFKIKNFDFKTEMVSLVTLIILFGANNSNYDRNTKKGWWKKSRKKKKAFN